MTLDTQHDAECYKRHWVLIYSDLTRVCWLDCDFKDAPTEDVQFGLKCSARHGRTILRGGDFWYLDPEEGLLNFNDHERDNYLKKLGFKFGRFLSFEHFEKIETQVMNGDKEMPPKVGYSAWEGKDDPRFIAS